MRSFMACYKQADRFLKKINTGAWFEYSSEEYEIGIIFGLVCSEVRNMIGGVCSNYMSGKSNEELVRIEQLEPLLYEL